MSDCGVLSGREGIYCNLKHRQTTHTHRMQTSLRTTLLALTLPSLAFGQDAACGDEVVANSGLYLTVEYVEDDDTQI